MPQPTGRPDYNWEEFATPESFEKMKAEREAQTAAWNENLRRTGYTTRTLNKALEAADLEELKLKLEETREAIKREQAQLKEVGAGKKEALKHQIETLERREKSYAHLIEQRSEKK